MYLANHNFSRKFVENLHESNKGLEKNLRDLASAANCMKNREQAETVRVLLNEMVIYQDIVMLSVIIYRVSHNYPTTKPKLLNRLKVIKDKRNGGLKIFV